MIYIDTCLYYTWNPKEPHIARVAFPNIIIHYVDLCRKSSLPKGFAMGCFSTCPRVGGSTEMLALERRVWQQVGEAYATQVAQMTR